MMDAGISRLRLVVWLALVVAAAGVILFVLWPGTRGAVEFHLQRLGHENRETARESELALLSLGRPGRQALFDFLVRRLNIGLVPLSYRGDDELEACKVLAISRTGEVEVRGPAGPARKIILLADASVPAEKVFLALSEFARSGTAGADAVAFAPGSETTALTIDLAYLNHGKLESYVTLRVGRENVNLAGEIIAQPEDVAEVLKGKAVDSVRVLPRPGVRYARLLRYVYCLRAAGKRALFVFGDPEVFCPTSPERLDQLTRSLAAGSENDVMRAAVALEAAVGNLFACDAGKPPSENRTAIADWMKWFERNRNYLYYDTVTGRYMYDAGAAAAGMEHERYWLQKLEIIGPQPSSTTDHREGGR
jgi:hypothetical protein